MSATIRSISRSSLISMEDEALTPFPTTDTPDVLDEKKDRLPLGPSPKAQSWGALISIIIIVLMIIIGAFYAWGQRIASERSSAIPTSAQ